MINVLKILTFGFTIFLFNGCGNSDSNYFDDPSYVSPVISEELINGVVVDGYIEDATVCVDVDNNQVCSTNEISDQTDSYGFFGLEIPGFTQEDSLITIIATGGTDNSTDKVHKEIFSRILDMSELDVNASYTISPITDLVAHSYKLSNGNSRSDLNASKSIVAEMLGLYMDQIDDDPMKSIDMFVISQDLQHTKMLIQKLLEKHLPSQYDLLELNNKIKTEILEQEYNVYRIIIQLIHNLDLELNSTVPDNEIDFIVAQAQELKTTLHSLSKDTNLDVANLDRLQKLLDIKQDEIYEILLNADENSTLEIVPLDIPPGSITETIFNTTNAELDEAACTSTNGYIPLFASNSTNFSPETIDEQTDSVNGISIESGYISQIASNDLANINDRIDDTGITIFYPELENNATGIKETVFEDNYYFAYDINWINNNEQTVYVMTPKDDSGLYSCYRYELNSSNSTDIYATKVFRYEEL